jgi:hypothetical protein
MALPHILRNDLMSNEQDARERRNTCQASDVRLANPGPSTATALDSD